jgi:hypothetical protein
LNYSSFSWLGFVQEHIHILLPWQQSELWGVCWCRVCIAYFEKLDWDSREGTHEIFCSPSVWLRQTAQTLGTGGYIVLHISYVSTFFQERTGMRSSARRERAWGFMQNSSVILQYSNSSLYSSDIYFYLLIKILFLINDIYFCSIGIYKYY